LADAGANPWPAYSDDGGCIATDVQPGGVGAWLLGVAILALAMARRPRR
jgi:MYXO-CTERM domain-containing protein